MDDMFIHTNVIQ